MRRVVLADTESTLYRVVDELTVACAVAQEIASGSHHCARRRLSSFDVISAAIPPPSITQTGFTRNGRCLLAIPWRYLMLRSSEDQ